MHGKTLVVLHVAAFFVIVSGCSEPDTAIAKREATVARFVTLVGTNYRTFSTKDGSAHCATIAGESEQAFQMWLFIKTQDTLCPTQVIYPSVGFVGWFGGVAARDAHQLGLFSTNTYSNFKVLIPHPLQGEEVLLVYRTMERNVTKDVQTLVFGDWKVRTLSPDTLTVDLHPNENDRVVKSDNLLREQLKAISVWNEYNERYK